MTAKTEPIAEVVQRHLSTSDGYRRWLEAKPADAIAGYAGWPLSCPLHEYLAACGYAVEVEAGRVRWRGGGGEAGLPPWADWHQSAVDAAGNGGPVSATTALALIPTVGGRCRLCGGSVLNGTCSLVPAHGG